MQIHVSPAINGLLDDATSISVRHGKYYVGVEHLFEAVLEQSSTLPPAFEDAYLKTLLTVLHTVKKNEWDGVSPSLHEVFYTPRCAHLAREAGRLADRLNSGPANAAHLLLALLADAYSAPSQAMDSLGLARGDIIQELRDLLHDGTKPMVTPKAQEAEAAVPASTQSALTTREQDGPRAKSAATGSILDTLTRDLVEEARMGRIEGAVGRDKQMFEVMQVLGRKNKSSAILVGEAGVGKTKVVEGLAVAAMKGKLGRLLDGVRILELNMGALLSGTQFRGALEEKLTKLLAELEEADDVILFVDEIHLIMGAGATDGSGVDVANLLKPALGRGTLRCIGATTMQEYRKFIEKDPAIERRFQMVRVEPLSESATLEVLTRLRPSFETHHDVRISRKTMEAAVSLASRYMPNRQMPDKAIDVLDQACARLRLKSVMLERKRGKEHDPAAEPANVTPHDIRKIVSQITAVPLEELTAAERLRLDDLDRRLKRVIIGQDMAVEKVVAAIKKSRAGLADPERPDATMLFLGPSGVGKTQLAKELAEDVFGSADHLVTFDMSEYLEAHSVSKLLGAPPGYVGSEEEGSLTEAVRRNPHTILLFDEIEKAHPKIFDIFLPLLDTGRLKDNRGRIVSFRNCIIILTSNVGASVLHGAHGANTDKMLLDELAQHFRPEFINRIDEIVPFQPLLFEDLRTILRLMIDDLRRRLAGKGMGIRMYQGAYEHLAKQGYEPKFGARDLRRTVERIIVAPLSDKILKNDFVEGDMIDVLMVDGALAFQKGAPQDAEVVAPI